MVKIATLVSRAEELVSELETFAFTIAQKAKGLRGNDAQVLEDLSADVQAAAEELRERFEQYDEGE